MAIAIRAIVAACRHFCASGRKQPPNYESRRAEFAKISKDANTRECTAGVEWINSGSDTHACTVGRLRFIIRVHARAD